MSLTGDLGIQIPSIGGATQGVFGQSITYLLIGVVFLAIVGFGCWIYIDNKKFKYKIEIFENLGGTRYVKTGSDRAKVVKLGDGGEEILFLKRRKIFRNAYGRKMGHNLLWFAIGQDGYWYNVTLGDLDAKQGMLDIEPIDRDMRYMHVAIRKNIAERYRKTNFMEKYGMMLMGGVFLIIMMIGLWFLISQMGEQTTALTAATNTAKDVMDGQHKVLTALDNILSGSGVKEVTPPAPQVGV